MPLDVKVALVTVVQSKHPFFCLFSSLLFLLLNEKVGFKIPTTRYRKNSILCGALHIVTAKWTSGVGWSFGASRVARGIKGS